MPRRKRSETTALAERPVAPQAARGPGTEIRRALCPVCGVYHGYRRDFIEGKRGLPVPGSRRNYWTWGPRDPGKPLGIIQISRGKGELETVGFFGPDDDPDGFFEPMKAHFLAAISEWHAKGWISGDEVAQAVAGNPPPPPPPRPRTRPTPTLPRPTQKPTPSPAPRPAPPPDASELARRWSAVVDTINSFERMEGVRAERLLEQFERDFLPLDRHSLGLAEVFELLEEFRVVTRGDFDDQEAFQEAREEAWEEFKNAVQEVDISQVTEGK